MFAVYVCDYATKMQMINDETYENEGNKPEIRNFKEELMEYTYTVCLGYPVQNRLQTQSLISLFSLRSTGNPRGK